MSTTLPHGIIQINEGNIAWYGDITANWQLIDSKIGVYDAAIANIPAPANNGTLTINYGGTTLAIFGADDAGNVSADIPAPGDGTLTVTQGGSTLGTFSANQATPETIDIPAPGDGTLTVTQGGSTLGSFSANQAAAETIDIPAPGDGTLTIKVNGSTAGTFTANQSTAATANITVPTAVSELVNDSGYLTSSSNLDASKLTSGTVDIARLPQGALERLVKVANEAARYALTTADVQLGDTVQQLDTGIMYVVTDTDHLDSAAGYTEYTAGTAASVPWSGVTGKPTFAAVATSGAYSDLTGTPTIPTVNNATLTIQRNGTTIDTFTANASVDKTININTADDTKIPLAGSNQISGSLIPATTNTYNLGSASLRWNTTYTRNILIDNDINIASSLINKTSTSGVISIRGGINPQDGASISLYGKDYNGDIAGSTYMLAYGNSDYTSFRIYPNGAMSVYNNSTSTTKNVAMREDVVPRSGGAVMTGNRLGREVDTGMLIIDGGGFWNRGASVAMYGKDSPEGYGMVWIHPADGSVERSMYLKPDGTWTWNGQAVQLISDQRLKQQITEIDDKLLDAWQDVNLVQFKYNDAVNEKGTNARLHTGYVVQQIDSACKSHNVDISQYGLFCHEEYPEETEEVEVEQKDGTKVKERKVIREASEHYSLRYTEVYAIECMYLRRCIKQLTARIEELEKGNKEVEK